MGRDLRIACVTMIYNGDVEEQFTKWQKTRCSCFVLCLFSCMCPPKVFLIWHHKVPSGVSRAKAIKYCTQ